MYRKFKNVVFGLLAHGTPSIVFSRILRSETLVYNSYFFQSSRFTAIIRCYVSVKLKLQHAPPPGIPRAFDTFAVPERREFDFQSLPGGGEFDPHALGVGDLNCTLDFM